MLAWHYTRSNKKQRRSKRHQARPDGPTRQLTVRSGRVVPLNQTSQRGHTSRSNSLDLGSPKSDGSTPTLHEKELQYPAATYKFDRRRSSVPIDLEAQKHEQERQTISEKVLRTLGERQRPSTKAVPKGKKLHGIREDRQVSIVESLSRAYKGPPIPGTEPVELPASPLSSPIIVRKLSMAKKSGNPARDRPSPPPVRDWRDDRSGRRKTLAGKTVTFSAPEGRRHSEQPRKTSLPEDVELPTPRFTGERDSFRKSVEEHDFTYPKSFFSDSTGSSVESPISPLIVSPLRPSLKRTSESTMSAEAHNARLSQGTASPFRRKSRPPDIETNIPNARESWYIDTSSSSKTVKDMRRGPSVMSNRSDTTFASSEIPTSTQWTFGNARALSIAPSVKPQPLSMPPVQRPKSKYRRRTKNPRNKRLPVLPSPLSQWERD